LFVVCCLLFVVCCLLFVVCCLLFVVVVVVVCCCCCCLLLLLLLLLFVVCCCCCCCSSVSILPGVCAVVDAVDGIFPTVPYATLPWFMVMPMWHEHQRDSEADGEAGTAARQQLAQTLDQLRRETSAGTAAADAKVLLRVLFAASLPGTHRAHGFLCVGFGGTAATACAGNARAS
jgi:hypothetical protein